MTAFKPSAPFTVPIEVYAPSVSKSKGVVSKNYPDSGPQIWCNWKTYGGTERDVDGLYVIEDTAQVETYYNPSITSDCIVKLCETGETYEILNAPEDIDRRHQWMKFKVRRISGGA